MIQCIDGKKFRDMFVSGANNLQNNKDLVDKLNVFPVPDGDTGTNMSLTISYAIKELSKVENDDITNVGKALSKGSLMGARGNSGVILSQIIRGIAKSVEGKETLNVVDLANALKNGSDTAYKAVIKPIEGTILTVVRESGEYALQIAKEDINVYKIVKGATKKSCVSLFMDYTYYLKDIQPSSFVKYTEPEGIINVAKYKGLSTLNVPLRFPHCIVFT